MIPSKGMLPLLIMEILRKHTDEEHTLDQKDILELLHSEYGLDVERKAIRRNLAELISLGQPIEYTETPRDGGAVWTDFWLVRDITDSELRLIIDSLLFSNHIPHSQRRNLIKKIENLSGENFHSHIKHISSLRDTGDSNKQIFYNIEVLDRAITGKRQVSFQYVYYDTDKKLHPAEDGNGIIRKYIVNPYQMAAKDGKYYLICNYDSYDDISNYRIDRIVNIEILDSKCKPFSALKDANGKPFDLGEYMLEHIYMHHGGSTRVRFKIVRAMISDVIDIFGKDVRFEEETATHVTVSARVNEESVIRFAQSCAPDVVILEPKPLVDRMKKWADSVRKAYGK